MKHAPGLTLKLERARFLLSFAIVATGLTSLRADTQYFINSNGNWNVASNWNAAVPSATDVAIISNSNKVSVPSGVTGVAQALGLGIGSTLTINGGKVVAPNIAPAAPGTSNFVVVSGGGTLAAGEVDLGGLGTVTLNGATIQPTANITGFFRNLGPSGVTINSGGVTFNSSIYSVVFTNAFNGGPLTVAGGAVELAGSNNFGLVTVNGGTLQLGGLNVPSSVAGAGSSGNPGAVINSGGMLVNAASSVITGGSGAGGGFSSGDGTGGDGLDLKLGGGLLNSGTINGAGAGSGALTGGASGGTGVSAASGTSFTNLGSIQGGGGSDGGGGGTAVAFAGTGTLTNGATGSITGGPGSGGTFFNGGGGGTGLSYKEAGILINSGQISGGNGSSGGGGATGVSFSAFATVTNLSGGMISGGGGSSGFASAGGGGTGIQMNDGGVLFNAALVQGGSGVGGSFGSSGSSSGTGVVIQGGPGTVINEGTINNGITMGSNFGNQLSVFPGSHISGGANLGNSTDSQLIFDGDGVTNMSSTISGGLTFNGQVVVEGGGTWNLDMAIPTTGTTYLNGSSLQVVNGGSLGSISLVNDGVLEFNRSDSSTFAASISGSGSFQNTGSGTVTLTGSNTFAGGTILEGGTLQVSSNGAAIYSPGADLIVGNNSAASLVVSGGAAFTDNNATLAETLFASGSTVTVKGAGSEWNNINSLTVGYFNAGSLTVEGGAKVTVNGGSGQIVLGEKNSFGLHPAVGTLQIGNGDSAGLLNISAVTVGAGTGVVIFDHTNSNYYLTQDGTAGGLAVPLSGNLSVTNNSGMTTLLGTNSYSGPTTINGGTLAIDGLLNGSPAITANGGTLAGAGTVTGTVAIGNGGGVSPGSPVGTLNTPSETWGPGTAFYWNLASSTGLAGTNWGLLQITGDLAINASNAGSMRVSLRTFNGSLPGLASGFNGSNSGAWTIATYTGNLTGFNSNLFVIDATNFLNETYAGQFHVSADVPHQLQLVFVPNFTPSITGEAVVETNARYAVVKTAINTAASPIQLTIQYGTNASYGQSTSVQSINSLPKLASPETVILDLQPKTTYHYRTVLTWSGGTIEGADETFSTTADATVFGITRAGDFLQATSTNSPAGEGANNAIDGNIGTVYANDDVFNTGFSVFPAGDSVVTALTFISAASHPEDDPTSFVLAGSFDGTNFVTIASNAIPPFPAPNSIQSVTFPNSTAYNEYRLTFPTVANPATAAAMQIAEVEFMPFGEITSSNDAVSLTLPGGASVPSGYSVSALFDRQLAQDTNKFNLVSDNGACEVYLTPAAGTSVLKGVEMIAGDDDVKYPGRAPSTLTVDGTVDGSNYLRVLSVNPVAPTNDFQIQQFSVETNSSVYSSYRITLGKPQNSSVLQVGELRFFGLTVGPQLNIALMNQSVNLSWTGTGFTLQSNADLESANWIAVTNSVSSANGSNSVTLSMDSAAKFFRLAQ